jgi:probable O-glycosylation ligase (exosortase A-associated)
MDSLRGILLIASVAGISGIAIFRPFTGLLAFVAFSIVNPQSMVWSTTLNPMQPIAGATLLGYFVSSEPKRIPRGLTTYLLVALWAVFVVTTITAVYQDGAIAQLTQVSKILLMVFLSMAMVTSKERLLSLLRTVALSLGFLGIKGGIFAITTGGQFIVWGPENSFLSANNTIGVAWAMNIPLLFYLRRHESRRWLRYVMTAMMVLTVPALVCTFSRGALIMWRNRYRWVLVAGLIIILPFMSGDLLPERVLNRYAELQNYEDDTSAQSRFWTWEFCWRVGAANPMTGAGCGFVSEDTFRQYYPEFLAWRGRVSVCHSTWFTVFGEHGVPGFVLWIGLLGSTLVSVTRIRRAAKRAGPDSEWVVSVTEMLQAALLAYIIGGTFVDLNYFDIFYQLVAVSIMIATVAPRLAQREAAAGRDPQDPLNRGIVGFRPKGRP